MGIRSRTIHEWNYAVHVINNAGDVLETLALADNHDIAAAAFEAAMQARTWSVIELRNRGRVVRTVETGGYDTETKLVERLK